MDRKYVIGAAVAGAALLLVPGLAASLARAAKPLRRAAIRSGAVAWDEFRRAGAEVYEHVEDLVAEFRAEVEERAAATAAAEAEAAGAAQPRDA